MSIKPSSRSTTLASSAPSAATLRSLRGRMLLVRGTTCAAAATVSPLQPSFCPPVAAAPTNCSRFARWPTRQLARRTASQSFEPNCSGCLVARALATWLSTAACNTRGVRRSR